MKRPLLLILILALGLLPGIAPRIVSLAHATGSAANPLYFSHVVWLVMENHKLAQLDAGTAATNGSLTYTLNAMNSSAAAYNSGYESTSGSLPNYLAMLSGATQTSCDSGPATCGLFSVTNLVDGLEAAGLTWKAYMEGWNNSTNTNSCNGAMRGDGGTNYIAHHNPFIYFTDIVTSGTRCQDVVKAGSYAGITGCGGTVTTAVAGNLISDLSNKTTAPNFAYLVPNNYDNTHDCSNYAAIGDNYLKTLVPQILRSDTFIATPSVLIVTYDEGTDAATTEPIYTVWIGPQAQSQFKDKTTAFNHYSILKTIEDNWGIAAMTANDSGATSMSPMLYTYPTTTAYIDQMQAGSSCSNGMTITMPASRAVNVTILGIFNSNVGAGASGAYISSLNQPTDTFGVTLTDPTNTPRQVKDNPDGSFNGGSNVIEEMYGFSASKIPAGTITVYWGDNPASCSWMMLYIGNTAMATCCVSSSTNAVATPTSNPAVSGYKDTYKNSLEIGWAGTNQTGNSYTFAAEPGFKCFMCSSIYYGSTAVFATVYTGFEYNITSSVQPSSTISFNTYNGAGAAQTTEWTLLADAFQLGIPAPPPVTSPPPGGNQPVPPSGGNLPVPFNFKTSTIQLFGFNLTVPVELTANGTVLVAGIFALAVLLSSNEQIGVLIEDTKKKKQETSMSRLQLLKYAAITATGTTLLDYLFHLTATQPMEVPVYFAMKFFSSLVIAYFLIPRIGNFLSASVFTLWVDIYYGLFVVLLGVYWLSSSPNQVISIFGIMDQITLFVLWTFAHGLFFLGGTVIASELIRGKTRTARRDSLI